jgi:hypothetical protein
MTVSKLIIIVFVVLELSNILMLYFAPGSKSANAVGVFKAWEKTKEYPEIHNFVRYLVYWVAGSKLIFIFLLIGIIIFGDREIQKLSLFALALATMTFYWWLFPLIRKMDAQGEISPKNYSVVLGIIIFVFILAFLIGAFI